MHYWSELNPNATTERVFKTRFRVNAWTGVLKRPINRLDLHIFEESLTGVIYLDFLQHTLPTRLDRVEDYQRYSSIFHQDGAPLHHLEGN